MADELADSNFYQHMAASYAERAQADGRRALPLYHWSRPEVQYGVFRHRERFTEALAAQGVGPIDQLEVLDVGCGNGSFLRWLAECGANPGRLHGVEVIRERAENARQRSPGIDIRLVDGLTLPYADATFDVVTANVVFSSIVDSAYRKSVADEVRRVLRPGGALHLFDMRWVKPGSAHVVSISNREVDRLFPSAKRTTYPLLLAPPIARRLAPKLPFLAIVLERLIPWLNTHRYHLIRV